MDVGGSTPGFFPKARLMALAKSSGFCDPMSSFWPSDNYQHDPAVAADVVGLAATPVADAPAPIVSERSVCLHFILGQTLNRYPVKGPVEREEAIVQTVAADFHGQVRYQEEELETPARMRRL